MSSGGKTPDCGPHCKMKIGKILISNLRSVEMKHCKCSKCHGKPLPSR